ncbi:MAG: phage tail protein [Vampirovibrio sp.]
MTVLYTTQDGDTLDLICFQHYGSTDAVLTVLESNPLIANAPAELTQGVKIILPDWTAPSNEGEAIVLW